MAQKKRNGRRPAPRRQPPKKRASRGLALPKTLFRSRDSEFKPDAVEPGILRIFHTTRLQRLTLLKWLLYTAACVGMLVVQDVIMSRFSLLGATTDLVVCVILLITIMEGTEVGSLFVLAASALYYFSGSSPGPFSVALLTFTGIGASMFRQAFWHWNFSSIVLCGSVALLLFEMGTFGIALFQGLTHWGRMGAFLMTALLSSIALLPLFHLINVIGQIGGHTWKE